MSEASEAKRTGAKLQKNSGRGKFSKGDATLGPFVVDFKEYSKSFSITPIVWGKVTADAWSQKKHPALNLIIGKGEKTTRVWVIGEAMFQQMLDAWEQVNG